MSTLQTRPILIRVSYRASIYVAIRTPQQEHWVWCPVHRRWTYARQSQVKYVGPATAKNLATDKVDLGSAPIVDVSRA